ncbi:MAG: hypothetical protein HYY93_09720 [Planctomycetes bacterium]|nr:hypothetical protein [Planctomycetota bacterium]
MKLTLVSAALLLTAAILPSPVSVSAQQPGGLDPAALGSRSYVSSRGISLCAPRGWVAQTPKARSGVLSFTDHGVPVASQLEVVYREDRWPLDLNRLAGELKNHMSRAAPRFELLASEDRTVGGRAAHFLSFGCESGTGQRLVMFHTLILASDFVYIALEGVAPRANLDLARPQFDAALGSFQFEPRVLSEEEAAAFARFRETCASATAPDPAACREEWMSVELDGKRIGVTWRRLSIEQRGEHLGYVLRSKRETLRPDGSRIQIESTYLASADFSRQGAEETHTTIENATKRVVKISATCEGGRAELAIATKDGVLKRSAAVDPGTLIGEGPDCFALTCDPGVPRLYVVRSMPLREWRGTVMQFEFQKADPVRLGGAVVMASRCDVTDGDGAASTWWFDPNDRSALRMQVGHSNVVCRRITKDEAMAAPTDPPKR